MYISTSALHALPLGIHIYGCLQLCKLAYYIVLMTGFIVCYMLSPQASVQELKSNLQREVGMVRSEWLKAFEDWRQRNAEQNMELREREARLKSLRYSDT